MNKTKIGFMLASLLVVAMLAGCTDTPTPPAAAPGGVRDVNASVETGSNGQTVEQNNIVKRLAMDNTPGSVKHLYVLSAYSGQVIMYSTVDGKVTSSGKRVDPTTHADCRDKYDQGYSCVVLESMQADGSYGSSIEYLYWFDTKGVYHQIYPNGGMIITVNSEPLAVNEVSINLG